ncbi:MAG: methylenetetrahydrofolate reductase C-terminal domain-containing protein [Deltaproteobacteria bacterium]|nr:methylenetetrahydrofolate reductase C-terminal domain-containing protein [Candidatus Zymogenaceae bacterium]
MFRKALRDKETFCVNWELVPGRGFSERQQDEVIRNAEKAARSKKIHGIGITDNPGGTPALAVEFAAVEIMKMGIDPLVHVACRDKNRNELESLLYGLFRNGVKNLLVLSGDYPTAGGFGTAKPVFDFDPIHLLSLIGRMNEGLAYDFMGKTMTLAPTDFFCGAAVSPFKKTQAELVGQYEKLMKKIRAGAGFVVTQVGYDARKLHELMTLLSIKKLDVPVLANIFVLTYPAARTMNAGNLPGCVVTKKLLGQIESERAAPDKGKGARIMRAAKQYAIARGMGCAGVHIGGHGIDADTVVEIIERGQEIADDWERYVPEFDYPQEAGYYLFEKQKDGGLNSVVTSARRGSSFRPPSYLFSRMIHAVFFEPKSPVYGLMRLAARLVDSSRILTGIFAFIENVIKVILFECRNCGDCSLFDVAYLCPMSQCPKEERNGPCGGSTDGWCEVYPGTRECVWVRAYGRLARKGAEPTFSEDIVAPCDWALWRTSSWINYFLGRDHIGKKIQNL